MGDRVSVQFQKDDKRSVAFFNHWGGKSFPAQALEYAEALKAERGDSHVMPLDRLEPDTVMVDFIRHVTKDETRIESSLYLGKDGKDGDNSDNGNFVIDLDKMAMIHEDGI